MFTLEEFQPFFQALSDHSFTRVPHQQIIDEVKQGKTDLVSVYGAEAVSKIKHFGSGIEETYQYLHVFRGNENVRISVRIYTTCVVMEQGGRKSDELRVLIMDSRNRKPRWYSPVIRRTPSKNCFATTLCYAKAAKNRAETWPVCRNCAAPLRLSFGNEICTWFLSCPACNKNLPSRKKVYYRFYEGMTDLESVAFLQKKYEQYDKYRKRFFEKNGRYPTPEPFVRAERLRKKMQSQVPPKKQMQSKKGEWHHDKEAYPNG